MRRGLLIAALCACALPARAQDGLPDRLAAACRELESNDPKRAFAAVQAISQLGGTALPALEERLKESKGRVHDYLEIAAEEIRNAPFLPSYPPVKRVTMKSTDRNVVDLLSDLRAKTGIPLSLDNLIDEDKLPEIPFEVKDATVLEAFDAICHAGNVTVSMDGGHFTLFTGAYMEQPRFFYGHYYFRLGEFDITKTVTFRKPAEHRFNLRLEMLWDPAAAPSRFKAVRLFEALDDRGKSLLLPPPAPGAADEEPDQDDGPELGIALLPPSPAATKVSVLRGCLPILLPKTRVGLVIDAPASGKTVTVGDLTLRVADVDLEAHSVQLKLSSKKQAPEALEKLDYTARVDLKGWDSGRYYVLKEAHGEHELEIKVQFEPLRLRSGPVKPLEENPPVVIDRLELSVVTSTQEKRVPFEFRDLKLK